jgi:hypothetical protein
MPNRYLLPSVKGKIFHHHLVTMTHQVDLPHRHRRDLDHSDRAWRLSKILALRLFCAAMSTDRFNWVAEISASRGSL